MILPGGCTGCSQGYTQTVSFQPNVGDIFEPAGALRTLVATLYPQSEAQFLRGTGPLGPASASPQDQTSPAQRSAQRPAIPASKRWVSWDRQNS